MTLYKGGVGQWSWILHRVTGVAVLLFLFTHILDTALIMVGPLWYNRIIAIYRMSIFGLMEIGLFAAVLYHAVNGVRIIIMDLWVGTTAYYKQLFWVQTVIFLLVFLPVGWIMLGHALGGVQG